MDIRRVVTGVDPLGKSTVVSDGAPPRSPEYRHTPGLGSCMIWGTDEPPVVPTDGSDPTPGFTTQFPPTQGSRMHVIELPPDSSYAWETFDPEAAAKEMNVNMPGMLDYFEEGSPFHATPSVDYHLQLNGELWLLLDDGAEVCIRPGDVVVQNGTRHHWENRGNSPARFAVVAVGAVKGDGIGTAH